jgi:hypothetical protein
MSDSDMKLGQRLAVAYDNSGPSTIRCSFRSNADPMLKFSHKSVKYKAVLQVVFPKSQDRNAKGSEFAID